MAKDFLLVNEDTLECPVCLCNSAESFCVFPCGHSVCHSCTMMVSSILKSTWTGTKFYECPVCRQQVSPSKGQSPPRNFIIQNLLDSATHVVESDLSAWENVTEKEKEQLAGRIAEQQDRIKQLEFTNGGLWTQMNQLLWTALFIFILALIFLAALACLVKGTQGSVKLPTSKQPVFVEPQPIGHRILVWLLQREATDPADKLIVQIVRTVGFICGGIHFQYLYSRL